MVRGPHAVQTRPGSWLPGRFSAASRPSRPSAVARPGARDQGDQPPQGRARTAWRCAGKSEEGSTASCSRGSRAQPDSQSCLLVWACSRPSWMGCATRRAPALQASWARTHRRRSMLGMTTARLGTGRVQRPTQAGCADAPAQAGAPRIRRRTRGVDRC